MAHMELFLSQLTALMDERDITITQLARLTDIKSPNVHRILNGENISINRATMIAESLGFTLSRFLSRKSKTAA